MSDQASRTRYCHCAKASAVDLCDVIVS